jgi:2,3,4,5-tetrahydropyridine-2-carboxylate N-succinyltransferase
MTLDLQSRIEALINRPAAEIEENDGTIAEFLEALNSGTIRAASPTADNQWVTNTWVKQGILLCFRLGRLIDFTSGIFPFFDKHTIPLKPLSIENGVRVVPGGSSVRTGAYLAPGVICMPPMYVNIGAYVDEGTLIDSHALVGSCAQIGKRVHLSAAAQIGGVLEPVGARPVIIEDDVFVGGNCGIYEGCLVRRGAVLAPGVILTAATRIYDVVNDTIITRTESAPLEVPENAVVVPGARGIDTPFAREHNLSLYTPVIVKYRDEKTDAATTLETTLR